MRKLLFLIAFLFFFSRISAFGTNLFYAEFTLTSTDFGTGAQFPCKVWFNGGTGEMRIDYSDTSGNVFMRQYYNYGNDIRYSVCNDGKCTTATWTADLPLFVGNSSTYTQASSCVTPNWPGPKSCTNFPSCVTYNRNSPKTQDIYSLSYLDSSSFQLCLIKWRVNEWHITKYVTSSFTTAQNPTGPKVYTDVQAGATQTCPQPVCSAQIDIAIVVDESKSIFDAGAWNTVQDFVKDLIGTLDIKSDGSSVRAGLVYFSGILNGNGIDCTKNWSISSNSAIDCPGYSRNGNCGFCGARWQQLTTGVISSKTDLIAKVNGNPGAQGATCISCGLDVGTKILNVFPKANTQKLIILFTDGAENCVTGRLKSQAKIAYDQGVKIIAVGAGKYDLDDLKLFTDTIYTTSPGSFSELQSLIPKIVTPLCTTLDDNCNFCSGICACKATCACPACNDYNACTDDKCDPRLPPDGTAGVCVTTSKVCDDFDKCTQNLCNPSSGCYYTTPTVKDSSQVDTFCKRYVCGKDTGFVLTDVGKTVCVQAADTCILNYCNTTFSTTVVNGQTLTGSCVTINRTDPMYPQGSTIAFVDTTGQTVTYPGCGRPSTGSLPCEVYGCTNGGCTVNSKGCVCRKDSDCDDSDGCTTDTCDTQNNKCLHTAIDCWSVLSNGNCKIGVAPSGGASTVTGDSFYAKTGSFPVDGSGLPSPNVQTRTCDNLACYAGQQSTYTCFSNTNATYTCKRQTTPCTSSACTYTSCKSLGTWNTNNQLNTDCSKTYPRSCADTNLCTSDSCNTTWTATSCFNDGTCTTNSGGNRCLNPSNATNCNDNSVCTTDTCNSASGCVYTNLPPPTSNFCFITGCDSKTGNFSNVNTTRCVQDPANLCNITYCDTSNQRCAFVDKSQLPLGTKVTYVDAYGATQTVVGCFKAPTSSDCKTYGCNAATGQCTINGNSCGCDSSILPVDPKCDDGNGCTVDTCTAGSGVCVNTPIDCWKIQSNSGCSVNQGGLSATNATGMNNYNSQNGADNAFVAPNPGTYNCDQMACYSGIRSTYTCVSTSSSQYTCQRDKTPCTKGGCKDTVCTSLGTWTNNQLNTDCSTTITPTCTSTKCSISECDVNYVFGSGSSRCIVTSNATNCDDNDACTQNLCDPVTLGCNYPPLPNPFGANTTCTGYACNSVTGWQPVDLGITQCTNLPTNKCQVTYCEKSNNTCIRLDRTLIPAGQSITYTDSAGVVQSLSGCGNPGDPLKCRFYSCDGLVTGQCTVSTSACNCIDDAGCQDGDGCTVDKCDIVNNVCLRTSIDCFSVLSNGTCSKNTNFAADVFTGINVYYGNASNPNNYTAVDANYLPSPSTGTIRTCAQLGCYNGQPSNYTCFSVKEGTYNCQRIFANCSRNGCQDNICRTTGSWINGQIETNCGTIFQPFCADDNACTNDFCNVAWAPPQPLPERCLHVPVNATSFCDDGNFCTEDFCDGSGTSGDLCKHRLYDTSTLKKKICKNVTSVCQTVTCTVNKCIYGDVTCLPPTLCIFHICNSTTAGVCKQYPTGLYKIDKCGICGGNGLSCVPTTPGNPKKTSIAVALGVGLGVGLAAAAIIIFILSKKSYDYYSALATETLGTVTTAPTYQGGEHHFDTSGYNGNNN